MSRRSKILIAITIVVLIVMVVIVYLLWKEKAPANSNQVPLSTTNTGTQKNGSPNTAAVVPQQQVTPFATAEATARSFVERWGSFSTESDFQNVKDLYSVMTPTMRDWSNRYIVDQRRAQKPGEFFGVTTRVMKTEITEQQGDAVKIFVTTQRVESTGSLPPRSYYQSMEVALVKSGNGYLVDGAWWK